jgi:hypothetical protein
MFKTFVESSTIDFETYPNGAATCGSCEVSAEFVSRGVEFHYQRASDNVVVPATLENGENSPYGISGDEGNHFVTVSLSEAGIGQAGHMTMSLAGIPNVMRFDRGILRGVTLQFVGAFDRNGDAIPASSITTTTLRDYVTTNGNEARMDRITITSATGIQRVVVNMTANVQIIDNISFRQP